MGRQEDILGALATPGRILHGVMKYKKLEEVMKEGLKMNKRKFHINMIGKIIFSMLLIVSVFIFQNAARAEGYLLEKTAKTIYVGDELDITDYFSEKEIEKIGYSIAANSLNASCVGLENGEVIAKAEGTAIINVTYTLKDETQERTETFTVSVLAAQEFSSSYGSLVDIKAFTVYSPVDFTYSFSEDSVAIAKDEKNLLIQGFKDCEVYVKVDDREILVAKIVIKAPDFQAGSQIARAVGTEAYSASLSNYTAIEGEEPDIEWGTGDEKIAAASEKGITPVAVGTTSISAKITAINGDVISITATLTVTNPKLAKTTYAIAVGLSKEITVSGTCSYSTYEGDGNDLNCAYFVDKKKLYANFKGTATLSFVVDGKTFTLKVVVTNPKYSKTKFTMYKGQKKQFTLSGINKTYSSITYASTNKKVATVTSKGVVRALKTGVTRMKAKADGKTITVWIEISTKKAYRAAQKEIAISKRKTRYSQARRMSKGYYDCSSIVSRVYRQYGVYFGRKSGWAPTAAGIGQWCTRNHKVIAKKGISYNKLVPGDLIFYSYKKNGRYRNISHIEMYVGNGKSVSASSSYNRVVHYSYKKSSVVLIARPTK